MHFLKRFTKINSEDAVSPVIGVMLMLVVTIIIAAVVSAFSGGLIGGTDQKAPTLTMDIKISNTGSWSGSGFTGTVTSVSAPIHTKNLKIVTSWKTSGKTGGDTSLPLNNKVRVPVKQDDWGEVGEIQFLESNAPYGYGPGVNDAAGAQSHTNPFAQPDQQFGNYTLVQGTGLVALPYGSCHAMIPASQEQVDDGGYGVKDAYTYTSGGAFTGNVLDPTQAVLGKGWENLRVGDIVNVKVIHIPTGKVILEKNVAVTEG
jgi:FlaG/FlaF family flagellin (archaellin)